MNELETSKMQTPIEIALGVDENGMTTARKLYEEGKNHLILSVFVWETEPDADEDENEIRLGGYVCKIPVYRKTPLGREIADMLIAVNRSYGKSDYIPCIAWGRNARYVSGLPVGTRVELVGRIQSREYTKKYGDETVETKIAYEVSVSRIEEVMIGEKQSN